MLVKCTVVCRSYCTITSIDIEVSKVLKTNNRQESSRMIFQIHNTHASQ